MDDNASFRDRFKDNRDDEMSDHRKLSSPSSSRLRGRCASGNFDDYESFKEQGIDEKEDDTTTTTTDPITEVSTSSLSALIVEDSLVISKATKRMLSKAGYVVDVADNGAIGLEKMKNKLYTIVVMDLQVSYVHHMTPISLM
jgi:PleD family two-component response regulator